MSTSASGEISGLLFKAIGVNPPIAVSDVSTMGRKRISPACLMAAFNSIPSSRNWLVKSTNRIEFFTSTPANAMKPMMATKDSGLPVSHNISTPPMIPNGITESTMSMLLKVLNSSSNTMMKRNTVAITTVPKLPPKASCLDSTSPANWIL